MNGFRMFLLALAAALALPVEAHALAGGWQQDEAVAVRLIAGVDGVGQEKTVPLGLDIQLAPGWHTYWRTPGMAGLPPQIDWKAGETEAGNLQSAALLYPAPARYSAFGLETVGYTGHVVLPIDATLRASGKPLAIDAALDLLICSDICVPKHFALKLEIPAGPAKEGAEAASIRHFRGLIPDDGERSGLSIERVANDGQGIEIRVAAREALEAPDLFVENGKNIGFTAPQVTLAPDRRSATFRVAPSETLPEGVALAGLPLTLTLVDGQRALEQGVTVPAAVAPPVPAPEAPALPLGLVILFAIVGGFILNLMPCVLPVLSLKVLSVISHGGGEERVVRHSFLVTAAGILFSYLALALATIALRGMGLAVGWGVQFQQPVFLGLLVLLLTFFAANLWGLFEIRLPRFLADNLSGPYHPKLASDFATGAFATLLATPCTAPFLGTAVGFALAAGPREILVIFTALGFGMALPYLVIALLPHFATALPRPGAWMLGLRHALGWALAATAAWLVWVLAAQITVRAAAVVAVCMMAIMGLFVLRRLRPAEWHLNFGILSFAILALGTALSGSLAPKPAPEIGAAWRALDEAAIARDVAAGKTVFVDVTADWCLTCKANEKFVLAREEITQRLFRSNVVPMQADWTNPDPVIEAFLQKHRRYGIPFNAVFGPGAPQGLVLPELLTPQIVIEALDKAALPPQP